VRPARFDPTAAGYSNRVPDPTEKTEELVEEAERGTSDRTPWLVLGGVHIAVAALVALVLAIAFVAYLIA
jgi:hypothetical protein